MLTDGSGACAPERRHFLRVSIPYPVRVRGVNASGKPFRYDTVVDNLSVGGLLLQLPETLEVGTELTVALRLAVGADERNPAPRMAARATVLRVVAASDGKNMIAMKFTRRRIL